MPFVLLIAAALAIMSGFKGTYLQLGAELADDFKGSAGDVGYIWWSSSVIMVGALGYYTPAQKFSRAFMFLIIIGMILANNGVFKKLQEALKAPNEPTQTTLAGSPTQPGSTQTASANTSSSSDFANVASGVKSLASAANALAVFAFV